MPPFTMFPNLSKATSMDIPAQTPPPHSDTVLSPQKRKRSPSVEPPAQSSHPSKAAKTSSSHLQINYLARQYTDILPLITIDDSLPALLSLMSDYEGVIQRHESMAGNLGARPLGPILVQRFERLFDGPPRVLKASGKEGTSIGWLDVVEFARNKPQQFNLEKMRDGVRVCQFFTKQCRVEISEEDYLLISSGMVQKMIPPQPIEEDEEKELGTLEILEKAINQVIQTADHVSAKARQLNHRLKNRKFAIISKREAERPESNATDKRESSPSHQLNGDQRPSVSPPSGFVAVNSKPQQLNGLSHHETIATDHPRPLNSPSTNGYSCQGASAATRAELLNKFHTNSDRPSSSSDPDRRSSNPGNRPGGISKSKSKPSTDQSEYASFLNNAAASPVPIPNTPSSLMPYVKPTAAERSDDSGPYKADMMLRMEQLKRGERVQPPCDRCRRLHMDCLKNLTACQGCTRKHAKCSWKEVEEQELKDHPFVPRVVTDGAEKGSGDEGLDPVQGKNGREKKERDWAAEGVQGVRDEELLGEESDDDEPRVSGVSTDGNADARYEARSHSPTTNTAADRPRQQHDGACSAPATTMQSSPAPQIASPSKTATSPAPLSNAGAVRAPHDIPLYRPPQTESLPAVRYFSAHEWDQHTRQSPSNPHVTPSSDIHDELKLAALEVEKHFERGHDQRASGDKGLVRAYTAGSDPSSASSASSNDSEYYRRSDVEKPAPSRDVVSQNEAENERVGQPTPPPETANASQGLIAVARMYNEGEPRASPKNDEPYSESEEPATTISTVASAMDRPLVKGSDPSAFDTVEASSNSGVQTEDQAIPDVSSKILGIPSC